MPLLRRWRHGALRPDADAPVLVQPLWPSGSLPLAASRLHLSQQESHAAASSRVDGFRRLQHIARLPAEIDELPLAQRAGPCLELPARTPVRRSLLALRELLPAGAVSRAGPPYTDKSLRAVVWRCLLNRARAESVQLEEAGLEQQARHWRQCIENACAAYREEQVDRRDRCFERVHEELGMEVRLQEWLHRSDDNQALSSEAATTGSEWNLNHKCISTAGCCLPERSGKVP